MKKLVIRMTNGHEIIIDNGSLEELANAIASKPMPKFMMMGKTGNKCLVNVKQIAYAKEVEE